MSNIKDFVNNGKSKYICSNFKLRCLNMGTDQGRECNADFDCKRKKIRKSIKTRVRKEQ